MPGIVFESLPSPDDYFLLGIYQSFGILHKYDTYQLSPEGIAPGIPVFDKEKADLWDLARSSCNP